MPKRPITNLEYSDKELSSFFYLADETFGIDFRKWYLDGEWTDRYRCYSLTSYRNVVSNVGMSRMTLMVDGTAREVYQIGTVTTDEDRQGQGLATRIFKHVFKQHDTDGFPYLLACDDGVEPFYEHQGFSVQPEPELFVSVSGSAAPLDASSSMQSSGVVSSWSRSRFHPASMRRTTCTFGCSTTTKA